MNRTLPIVVVAAASTLPFVAALLYFDVLAGTPLASALYAATKLAMLVAAVAAGLRPGRPRLSAVPLGLATGAIVAAAIAGLYYLTPLGEAALEAAPAIRRKIDAFGVLEWYVPFAVFLAAAHSLLEEAYWRGFVFARLERFVPRPAAIAVSSLAFSLHHLVVLGAYFGPGLTALGGLGVATGGAIWAWLYARQQSLVGAWTSHVLADAVILAIGYGLLFG